MLSANYKSSEQYDSAIQSGQAKDSWIEQQIVHKNFELTKKFKNNGKELIKAFVEKFLHSFPQMFFVLLPLFAAILKLLYVRSNQFYYTDHVIFTLHTYIFVFIAMLAIFCINKIKDMTGWGWLGFVSVILVIGIFFHFYKSLLNFYAQGKGKTILKFFLILVLLFLISIFLFTLFLILSLYRI